MLAKRSASRFWGLGPPSSDLSKGKQIFRPRRPEVWVASAIQPSPGTIREEFTAAHEPASACVRAGKAASRSKGAYI
jgi:hypothetical protein